MALDLDLPPWCHWPSDLLVSILILASCSRGFCVSCSIPWSPLSFWGSNIHIIAFHTKSVISSTEGSFGSQGVTSSVYKWPPFREDQRVSPGQHFSGRIRQILLVKKYSCFYFVRDQTLEKRFPSMRGKHRKKITHPLDKYIVNLTDTYCVNWRRQGKWLELTWSENLTQKGKQWLFVGWLLNVQQHASGAQGRTCSEKCMCCHTETEAADQTFNLTQSQYLILLWCFSLMPCQPVPTLTL